MIKFSRDQNFIALFYLLFSILIASISFGINIVAFSAVLLNHQVSPFLIGTANAIEVFSSIILSFFFSKIVSRLTILKAAIVFAAIYCASILSIFFYQNFYLWLFFCVLNGSSWFALFVIRQAWINHLVHDKNRSIILALTTTIFCGGFIGGSFVVKYFGALNYTSFLLSSSFIALSILILILIKDTRPKTIDSQRIGFYDFFKHNPRVALAKFLLDLQNFCLITLTVIFGVKIGLSAENAGLLIAAFMASGMCDLYAGFLVKKYNPYKMIKLGFIGCLTTIVIAIFTYESYITLLILFFLFGASTASTFIATLTITNETFSKQKLIAANSTFQSIGAVGSLIGALCGGFFIQVFDFYGFFIAIILANIFYLTFTFFYEKKLTKN